MESTPVAGELRVSDDGLGAVAVSCAALAATLVGNGAPTAAAASPLGSAAAVNAAHARIAAAGLRCMARLQATTTKLTVAAAGYDGNEGRAAARFAALQPRAC
ncbi:hypothetical protein [Mycobacterium canetti]|uniref:hypothetical protein n=1 Tax=Mycobacterium canetti TaxID=78331 RepID=UPI0002A55386|nr:hypothetical protein [Mycobacterium canetti]CCK58289.1 Conserved protein of unknown function [Mycobacterium canettii CIPT 140070010]